MRQNITTERPCGIGDLDILITEQQWGMEFLRSNLNGHPKRFHPGGRYYQSIQDGTLRDLLIVDLARNIWYLPFDETGRRVLGYRFHRGATQMLSQVQLPGSQPDLSPNLSTRYKFRRRTFRSKMTCRIRPERLFCLMRQVFVPPGFGLA